jgi:hypothetical protein
MDNMGNQGKEILYNSCYGSLVLAAYANVAPYPFANVVGEDIFGSGIIPSDTDFHIYKEYGQVPGVDVAFAFHSYNYHSGNDNFTNVNNSAGSVQRTGDNFLQTILTLANTSITAVPGSTETIPNGFNYSVSVPTLVADKLVYFDIFGNYFL